MKEDLPVIDWALAKQVTGSQENALHLLDMLMKSLKKDVAEIKALYQQNEMALLQMKLHKLKGALSYCGVPRLKKVVSQLETEVKKNIMMDQSFLLIQLENEADFLLKHYPAIKPHMN